MSKPHSELSCSLSSWLLAAIVAVLAVVICRLFAELSWPGAIFVGVVSLGVLGLLFSWLFCRPLASLEELNAQSPAEPAPVAKPAAAPAAAAAPVAAATTAVAEDPAPAPKPAKKPAAKPKATKKAAAEKAPEPAGDESEPALMKAPKGGSGDDLKQIKGVGPKLEGTLNDLGIWHFEQIAAWTEKEIAWVDARLRFKGRIERDGWIDQATTLAAGGTTEFSKKVKKGDVYD